MNRIRGRLRAVVLCGASLAGLLLVAPFSQPVGAAEDERITWGIAPSGVNGPDGRVAFEYKLDPGAELTDYAGVFNFSDSPVTVAVYASDAFTTDQGGFDLLPAGQAPRDVGSWVAIDAATVVIPPRSRVDVPFRLSVPANATPGDHAGGIVVSVSVSDPGAGQRVTVDRRVGARLHLRVSGELAPAWRVQEMAATYQGTINPVRSGAVTTTFVVHNTGNVRLLSNPAVEVSGPFGLGRRTAGGGPPQEILPGEQVRTTVTVDGVAAWLRLSVVARITQTAGQPRQQPPPAESVVTLWVMPWPAVWLLVLAAAVVVALRLAARSRARAAARRQDELDRARELGRAEARTTAGTGQGERS